MSSRTESLEARDREMIPTVLLKSMLALVLASLAIVTFARVTHMPLAAHPTGIAIVQDRAIVLSGSIDGAARVTSPDGTLIADLDSAHGGFVAGIDRAVARERLLIGIDASAPLHLVKFADGRLALQDRKTGWHVDLVGFGADNTRVFAKLLK